MAQNSDMASEKPPMAQNDMDPLAATRTGSSGASDYDKSEGNGKVTRIQTSATAREERFEPIRAGDREELHRLASTLQRTESYVTSADALERVDTLAGIQLGDAVLDPNSPEFDVYKWARM